MIKDVIVSLEHKSSRHQVDDYAISIAQEFVAHIAGVCFAYDALPSFIMPDFPADLLASMLADNEKSARAAIERFDAAAKRASVSAEHYLDRTEFGTIGVFATLARRFDLSVIMQSDPEGPTNDPLIEATLFGSGRPLMVVPYIEKSVFTSGRIICCWDGSRAASRAINDALPLLKKAKAVELLMVADGKIASAQHEIGGIEMAKHLARHEVKVDLNTIPAAGIDAGNVILSHASDYSANIIVLGGYGHSRFREFILGGVTRGILSAMTVPVFISH
jgi:nucleotide-binding universal stress UspA family protein